MMQIDVKEVAQSAGLANWLTRESLNSGWYTCQLTGKKMRSTAAEEQFAKQDAALAEFNKPKVSPGYNGVRQPAPTAEGDKPKATNRSLTDQEIIDKVYAADGDAGVLSRSEFDRYIFMQTNMSARLHEHTAGGFAVAGKKFVTIRCVDCGTERIIKVQDQFQVTRCVGCQKKHRNAIRAARRKAKKDQ